MWFQGATWHGTRVFSCHIRLNNIKLCLKKMKIKNTLKKTSVCSLHFPLPQPPRFLQIQIPSLPSLPQRRLSQCRHRPLLNTPRLLVFLRRSSLEKTGLTNSLNKRALDVGSGFSNNVNARVTHSKAQYKPEKWMLPTKLKIHWHNWILRL
jgi:hypothetical protein